MDHAAIDPLDMVGLRQQFAAPLCWLAAIIFPSGMAHPQLARAARTPSAKERARWTPCGFGKIQPWGFPRYNWF
jgi:hypothetical protein